MKKIFFRLFILVIVILLIPCIQLISYQNQINKNQSCLNYCNSYDEKIYSVKETFQPINQCYLQMYSLLLPKILLYEANLNGQKINYEPIGFEYIIPSNIIEKSDAIISYGIGFGSHFENVLTTSYKKDVYAYDCGIREMNIKNPHLYFESECIGTDNFLMYGQQSSGEIHKFGEELKEKNLLDKKVYLKLGIPESHRYIKDILQYKDNILGISIFIDLWSPKYIVNTIEMLNLINKDFILVNRIRLGWINVKINNSNNNWSRTLSLTFINKKYVENYKLLYNQSIYDKEISINYIVILHKQLKNIKDNIYKFFKKR